MPHDLEVALRRATRGDEAAVATLYRALNPLLLRDVTDTTITATDVFVLPAHMHKHHHFGGSKHEGSRHEASHLEASHYEGSKHEGSSGFGSKKGSGFGSGSDRRTSHNR